MLMGASKGTHGKVLELLENIDGKRILDCGSGKGTFTERLIKNKGRVFACDIKAEDFKLKIPFKKADFNKKVPFPSSFFDKIVSIEVIEHLENPSLFIKELNRILRKEGILIITTPNIHNIKSKLQFLFKTNFHWFQKSEFGKNGSMHINPLYWREIYYLLNKYGFRIEKISANRYWGYTFYYSKTDNILKKIFLKIGNIISDILYGIFYIILFPKDKNLLLGDILIIKAKKV